MELDENNFVNIRVTRDTRDVLKSIGKKAQTYDNIIWALITYWNLSGNAGNPVSKDIITALRK